MATARRAPVPANRQYIVLVEMGEDPPVLVTAGSAEEAKIEALKRCFDFDSILRGAMDDARHNDRIEIEVYAEVRGVFLVGGNGVGIEVNG